MSKKHPVKSTQSSARPTATPARPQAERPTANAHASNADSDSSDTSLQAAPVTNPEHRAQMIAEAAYYLSEQRGFAPGHEVEDWLVAEQQIDSRIEDARGVTGPMQIS